MIHPVVTDDPAPTIDVHKYRFATELIEPVLQRAKTATIRYEDERNPKPRDVIIAVDQDDTIFAVLEVMRVHDLPVCEIDEYLSEDDIRYGASNSWEVLSQLHTHYPDECEAIDRWTDIRLLVFQRLVAGETNER